MNSLNSSQNVNGKVPPVLKHHAIKMYKEVEIYLDEFVNLGGTKRTRVVSIIPWPLYSHFPIDRR